MRRLVWLCLLGALSLPSPATAEFYTGNELHQHCNSQYETERILCMGYVAGAFDTMRTLGFDCPNVQKVTIGQAVDVMKNYLTANPSTRHRAASTLAGLSIIQAFGCKPPKLAPNQ